MTLHSRWTYTAIVLLSGFLLLVAISAGILTSGVTSHQLAARLSQQIEAAPPSSAPALLAQLAATGDAGVPALVHHLNSPHESVAAAAREEISSLLNRWRMLKAPVASPKAALLAAELAEQCPEFSPAAQRVAADFATRLLVWPVDRSAVDGALLIAHCGRVLRSNDDTPALKKPRAHSTMAYAPPTPGMPGSGELRYSDAVLRNPPGAPPVDIVSIPALPPSIDPVAPAPLRPAPPASPLRPIEAGPPAPPGAPPASSSPVEVKPAPASPREYPAGPARPLRPRTTSSSSNMAAQTTARQVSAANVAFVDNAADFENVPLFEVVSALQSPAASIVAAALTELRNRGFGAAQIRMAEWFVAADPARRMALINALPEATVIDPQQWLLWLTYDTDPQVRKAAVTSLSTSNSPGVARRLAQMELEESSPEVLRQVRRVRTAALKRPHMR